MSNNTHVNNQSELAPMRPLQVLSFRLGEESYGVDIQNVQELRRYEAVTWIANASSRVKGVINLRGIIVPIIDLRIKLGMGQPVYDQFTVVVLTVAGAVMGMVVDSVSDVASLQREHIKPAPEIGLSIESQFLTGLANVDGALLLLVDIDKLMTSPSHAAHCVAA